MFAAEFDIKFYAPHPTPFRRTATEELFILAGELS
jgi:hypothetical protein